MIYVFILLYFWSFYILAFNNSLLIKQIKDGDLNKFIKRYRSSDSKINEKKIVSIEIQILEGLKEIHSKGIIHRDIKPKFIF
jgi:serine/threonine protein kinase